MTHWDFKAYLFLRPWQNALKFAAVSPRLTTRGIHDVSSENKRNHSCNPRELHGDVVKTPDSQSMIFPRVFPTCRDHILIKLSFVGLGWYPQHSSRYPKPGHCRATNGKVIHHVEGLAGHMQILLHLSRRRGSVAAVWFLLQESHHQFGHWYLAKC